MYMSEAAADQAERRMAPLINVGSYHGVKAKDNQLGKREPYDRMDNTYIADICLSERNDKWRGVGGILFVWRDKVRIVGVDEKAGAEYIAHVEESAVNHARRPSMKRK